MMWKKLYEPKSPWYLSIWRTVTWKVSGLLRKLKRGPSGLVAWWKLNRKCKALNKSLLAEAERSKNAPMYPSPTPKDVQEFVEWAQAHGILFEQQCTGYKPVRKSKPYVEINE